MGGFYGSIHFRQIDRAQLLRETETLAASTGSKFLVGPERNGWTAVYPDHHGQNEAIAASLARALDAPALHLCVHDDDIFSYSFYRGATLVDEYNSCPDYFGDVSAAKKARLRGNVDLLRDTVGPGADLDAAKALIARRYAHFTFEVERLEKFATFLGIENAVTSYEYLLDGERHRIKGWKQFVVVPDERATKRAAASALKQAKDRLKRENLLLAEIQAPAGHDSKKIKHYIAEWCLHPAEERLWFVPREWRIGPMDDTAPLPLCSWVPGQNATEIPGAELPATTSTLALSPSGRWLAIGNAYGNWSMELRDRDDPRRRLVIPLPRGAQHSAFLPDESALLHTACDEIRCSALPDGALLWRAGIESIGRVFALHPSGRWIVADRPHGALQIFDAHTLNFVKIITTHAGMAGEFSGLPAMMEKLLASGISPQQAQAALMRAANPEGFATATFSADGEWLCTGSTLGLRVYRWSDVLAVNNGNAPAPIYAVDARPNEARKPCTYCYAVVVDNTAQRVLFAGLEAIVEALDLATGRVTTLLDAPEHLAIIRMELSAGRNLLVISTKEMRSNSKRSPELTVWSYPRLCEEAKLA